MYICIHTKIHIPALHSFKMICTSRVQFESYVIIRYITIYECYINGVSLTVFQLKVDHTLLDVCHVVHTHYRYENETLERMIKGNLERNHSWESDGQDSN